MSVNCFGRKYFAISNLFVRDIDGNFFTFPAPYSILLESDFKSNDTLEICYSSYYESPLVLDYIFSIFFYVIFFDGTIETIYLEEVSLKEEPRNESYGYKGIYKFNSRLAHNNISTQQFYGDLQSIKQTILPNTRNQA
jgi:hypothetical protein